MKKIICTILAVSMIMSLTSCKKKDNNTSATPSPAAVSSSPAAETPAADTAAEETPAPASAAEDNTPINGGSLTEENTVGVKENADNVTITLPSAFFDENTKTELTEEMKNQGYQSVTKNDDGSITYVMTKQGFNALKPNMQQQVKDYLEEVKSGDQFTSIKNVEYDDDFSTITLTVDRKAFESSLDVMASRAIYMMVVGYKIFCGESVDTAKVTIVYIDKSNKKEISRTVYPDDLSVQN